VPLAWAFDEATISPSAPDFPAVIDAAANSPGCGRIARGRMMPLFVLADADVRWALGEEQNGW
jgi:hypothetical protein